MCWCIKNCRHWGKCDNRFEVIWSKPNGVDDYVVSSLCLRSASSAGDCNLLHVQSNQNEPELVALVREACFRGAEKWLLSRVCPPDSVESIRRFFFGSLTQGSSSGQKAFCNIAAVFLTQNRAGESVCMSTSQTTDQHRYTASPAGRQASQPGRQATQGYLLHPVFHCGYLSTSKRMSGRGWSHPLITGAIMGNGCFPVAVCLRWSSPPWSVLKTQMSQFPIGSEISDVLIMQGSEITNVNRSGA